MKFCKNYFLLFLLLFFLSFSIGCFDDSDDDSGDGSPGTVTVTLTGASDHNGKTFYFQIFSEDDLVNALGSNSFTIGAGGGSGVIQSNGSNLSLDGGTYLLSCFVDEDSDADLSDLYADDDDDFCATPVIVNGDATTDLTYPGDFTVR